MTGLFSFVVTWSPSPHQDVLAARHLNTGHKAVRLFAYLSLPPFLSLSLEGNAFGMGGDGPSIKEQMTSMGNGEKALQYLCMRESSAS